MSPLQIPTDPSTLALIVASVVIVALTFLLLREQRRTNRLHRSRMIMDARTEGATANPMCKCTFESLPPYTEGHAVTKLIIHNGGNCSLSGPVTTVILSWMPKARIVLDWSPDTDFVVNEDKVFEFGIPEPPHGAHTITVRTDGVHPILDSPVWFSSVEHIQV